MNMMCPYCNAKNWYSGTEIRDIHEHIIKCSKKYLDQVARDHIAQFNFRFRAYNNLPPDPPLHVPEPGPCDRRSGRLGRRCVNKDRRVKDRTLYTTVEGEYLRSGIAHAGHYLNSNGYALRDRRKMKGLGRRNGLDDRRKS